MALIYDYSIGRRETVPASVPEPFALRPSMEPEKRMESDETERPRDAIEELNRSLRRIQLLMDACDAWLRDPDDPTRYDLGLRAEEVRVIYHTMRDDEGPSQRTKASLDELLKRIDLHCERKSVEPGFTDPRLLILKAAQELRLTVRTRSELARMQADSRAMETLRDALLGEISKVNEDVAHQIAQAVRSCLIRGGSPSGHGVLACGDGPR